MNDEPNPVTLDWLGWRYRDLHRRIGQLEQRDDKYDPAVMDERVKTLSEDFRALKKAFYTFAFSIVGSAVVFAFTVFALLGRHP
jgi:hypothetical protein